MNLTLSFAVAGMRAEEITIANLQDAERSMLKDMRGSGESATLVRGRDSVTLRGWEIGMCGARGLATA